MNDRGLSNVALTTLTLIISLMFAGMLYFRAATASLHDHYQPGFEEMRWLVSPGVFISLIVVAAVLAGSRFAARLAYRCSLISLVVCTAMVIFSVSYRGDEGHWSLSQDRNLESTIQTALLSPDFSNRSTLYSIGIALVTAICLRFSARLCSRGAT